MSIQTGICGTNLNYTLDTETGVLNITPEDGTTGTYNMDDYGISTTNLPPWYQYISQIREVNIPLQLKNIGEYAFCDAGNLTTLTCEDDSKSELNQIGDHAFESTALRQFPTFKRLVYIGVNAFRYSSIRFLDLSYVSPDVVTIGKNAFGALSDVEKHCSVIVKVAEQAPIESRLVKYLRDNYIPYDDGGSSLPLVATHSDDNTVVLYWDGTLVMNSTQNIFSIRDCTYSLLVRRAVINNISYFDGSNSSIAYTPLLQDVVFNGTLTYIGYICHNFSGPYSEHTYKNYVNSITFNFASFCPSVEFNDYSFNSHLFPEVYVNTTYNNTYEECLRQWLAIKFDYNRRYDSYYYSNPVGGKLYFANSLVKKIETDDDIGDYQFYGCNSIKTVKLTGAKQTVGYYAFASTSAEELYIGESVSSIGKGAFQSCKNLKIVTIPFEGESEDATGKYASLSHIFGKSSIENLTLLPSSRNIFTGNAFTASYKQVEIKILNLPDNISTISTNAFYEMTKLQSLRLPNNLQSVDFTGASNLNMLSVDNMPHFLKISATGKSTQLNVYFEDIQQYSALMNIVCPYSNTSNAATFNLSFQNIAVLSFATPQTANSDYIYANNIYYVKNKVTVSAGVAKNYFVIEGSNVASNLTSRTITFTDINYAGENTFYTYNLLYSGDSVVTSQNEMTFYSDYNEGNLFDYYKKDKPWETYKKDCKSVTIKRLIYSIPDGEFMDMTSMETFCIQTTSSPNIVGDTKDSPYYADLYLGRECFSGCKQLRNVTFLGYDDGVTDNVTHRIYFPNSDGFVFAYCTSLGQVNETSEGKIYLDNIANISEITDFGCNFNGCTSIKSIAFKSENPSGLCIQDNMLYSGNSPHSTLKWVPCGVQDSSSKNVYIQPKGTIEYIDAIEKHCFSGGNWKRIIFQRNSQRNNFSCKLLESSIYDCNNLSQENLPLEEQDQLKNGIVCYNRSVEFQANSIQYTATTFPPTIICYKGSTSDSTAKLLNYVPIIIYIEVLLCCDDAGFLYEGEPGQDVVLYSYLDKAKTYNYSTGEYYVNNSGSDNVQVKITGTVSNGEITPLLAPSYSYLTGVEEYALNGFELVSGKTVNFIINATNNSFHLQNNCFSNAQGIGSIKIPDNSIIVSNSVTDLITSSIFFNSNNISSIDVTGNHENSSVTVDNKILYANVYAENNTISSTVLMYSPPAREDTNGILKLGMASYINKYAFCRCINTKYFESDSTDGLLFINKEEDKKTLFRVPEDYTLDGEKITSLVVDRNVTEIETFAFNHCDNIKEIIILNPDCVFPTGVTYFNKNVVLRGYWDSTTEKYANKNNLIFKALNKKKFNLQSQDHYISVLINGDPGSFPLVRDTTVLDEFFRYILPTGYIVDYEFNSSVPDTETEIQVKSNISTLKGVQQYTKGENDKYIPYWDESKGDQPSNASYNIRNFDQENQDLSEKSADTLTLGNLVNLQEQKDSGK